MTATIEKIKPGMSEADVLATVSEVTGIPACKIKGKRRTHRVTKARFLCMAAQTYAHPHWSLFDVSATVGKADHSIIYYGLCRYRELYERDTEFRRLARILGLPESIRANYQRIPRKPIKNSQLTRDSRV